MAMATRGMVRPSAFLRREFSPSDPTRRDGLSCDSALGFAAGDVNLFRYVGNGPTNATDPSGYEEKKVEWKLVQGGYQAKVNGWTLFIPSASIRNLGDGFANYQYNTLITRPQLPKGTNCSVILNSYFRIGITADGSLGPRIAKGNDPKDLEEGAGEHTYVIDYLNRLTDTDILGFGRRGNNPRQKDGNTEYYPYTPTNPPSVLLSLLLNRGTDNERRETKVSPQHDNADWAIYADRVERHFGFLPNDDSGGSRTSIIGKKKYDSYLDACTKGDYLKTGSTYVYVNPVKLRNMDKNKRDKAVEDFIKSLKDNGTPQEQLDYIKKEIDGAIAGKGFGADRILEFIILDGNKEPLPGFSKYK